MKTILQLLFLFNCFFAFAQSGFNYQAVVRNNSGEIISNQSIGVRISIISGDINNPASYIETHTVTSNDYGVINLIIGQGNVITGNFNQIDWSLSAFSQVEMDIDGGTNYVDLGTTELLSVPKAMYAERAGNATGFFGYNVRDFGAVGDNSTDDTAAFQAALAAAATEANRVVVPTGNYRITETLVIPNGVTLIGEGTGSTPLGTPYNGSAIRYDGDAAAIELSGHSSGLRDLLVYDFNQGSTNASGVHVLANGALVESIRMFNVLIHYFIGGTALKLEAVNAGGIAYASFYNTRIRNAKTAIHITEDGPSFTNSNTFHHGTISGGGFDYGILIDGGNNNLFYGTIIEPPSTANGHIVINEGGEAQFYEIRVEATLQSATVPTIECKAGTRNSTFSGLFGHGYIIDQGDNAINFRSGKATFHFDSRYNCFENATFLGFDGTDLPFWDVTGAGVTMEIMGEELTPEHRVLKLTVPAGVTANLEQSSVFIPAIGDLPLYGQSNFGMYIKTTQPDVVYLRVNALGGVASSARHIGDDNWHFISMTANTDINATLDARLEIDNTTGSPLEVFVSVPTLTFGNQTPDYSPKPLTSNGGILNGTLTTSFYTVGDVPGNNRLVLPKEGNVFEITGTTALHRINDATFDRFPRGTVITLLFNDAGLSLLNSIFIQLKSSFVSTENSSLTLLSLGDGTWREVNRNN